MPGLVHRSTPADSWRMGHGQGTLKTSGMSFERCEGEFASILASDEDLRTLYEVVDSRRRGSTCQGKAQLRSSWPIVPTLDRGHSGGAR